MAGRFFDREEHSALYDEYMIREPEEIHRLILSYLEEKKGRLFELAVDVGCGTGRSTKVLAPYFQKVVGVDNSESQIQEAKRSCSTSNVSYMVAEAEKLPFKDESVDLITVSVAAHFFNMEAFLREVDSILKPRGCLALYSLSVNCELLYGDCSETITAAFNEALNFLIQNNSRKVQEACGHVLSEYREIFEVVPYTDKRRIINIAMRRTMTVAAVMGFLESVFFFQTFLLAEPEKAKELKCRLQERLLETMGTTSTDTELELCNNYCCILAYPELHCSYSNTWVHLSLEIHRYPSRHLQKSGIANVSNEH